MQEPGIDLESQEMNFLILNPCYTRLRGTVLQKLRLGSLLKSKDSDCIRPSPHILGEIFHLRISEGLLPAHTCVANAALFRLCLPTGPALCDVEAVFVAPCNDVCFFPLHLLKRCHNFDFATRCELNLLALHSPVLRRDIS